MDNKITIPYITAQKGKAKITMVTAYDYITARLAETAGIDIILVGDSMANVVYGHATTLQLELCDMIKHTRIVSDHIKGPLLVADMTFGSFHINTDKTVENAVSLMKYGRAEAVKLEGGTRSKLLAIEKLTEHSIPVMGHIGLTPQSVHSFGGYSVRGKSLNEAKSIYNQAKDIEKAGAFSIVLEGIPSELSRLITENISIPTIGIGAGIDCDGQVLVIHDLLGLTDKPVPRFVKKYDNLWERGLKALESYISDVRNSRFPEKEHCYFIKNLDINQIKEK